MQIEFNFVSSVFTRPGQAKPHPIRY